VNSLRPFFKVAALLATLATCGAQTLPGSLSFSTQGAFSNGVKESSSSLLIADNNLTNGYASGFDLKDAPTAMSTTGPAGSSAFQWGTASSGSAYPHSSALWFDPTAVSNVGANQPFKIADLYYRNGTIVSNTGASQVDLGLNLAFSSPSGISPISLTYTMDLVNTVNTSDPVASADIVRFGNQYQPLQFTDGTGKRYYLYMSFLPDQQTLNGTLSTADEFHVTEGTEARAELWGTITTVPEPSSLLLGALGSLLLFRRRR